MFQDVIISRRSSCSIYFQDFGVARNHQKKNIEAKSHHANPKEKIQNVIDHYKSH